MCELYVSYDSPSALHVARSLGEEAPAREGMQVGLPCRLERVRLGLAWPRGGWYRGPRDLALLSRTRNLSLVRCEPCLWRGLGNGVLDSFDPGHLCQSSVFDGLELGGLGSGFLLGSRRWRWRHLDLGALVQILDLGSEWVVGGRLEAVVCVGWRSVGWWMAGRRHDGGAGLARVVRMVGFAPSPPSFSRSAPA